MILLIHIVIALSSIAVATFAVFRPSSKKLKVSYGLTVATLTSGTFLVISTHSNLAHACVTGLFYLAVVSIETVAARQKLASEQI